MGGDPGAGVGGWTLGIVCSDAKHWSVAKVSRPILPKTLLMIPVYVVRRWVSRRLAGTDSPPHIPTFPTTTHFPYGTLLLDRLTYGIGALLNITTVVNQGILQTASSPGEYI